MDTFGWAGRIGLLLMAGALLWCARKVHKASGGGRPKLAQASSYAGVGLALASGIALLGTIVGEWMNTRIAWLGVIAVVAFFVCMGILIVDVLLDQKPDKPAFWAAWVLPLAFVFGWSQIPTVVDMFGDGAGRVGTQVQQVGQAPPSGDGR